MKLCYLIMNNILRWIKIWVELWNIGFVYKNFLYILSKYRRTENVWNSAERRKIGCSSCAYDRIENIVHTDRSIENVLAVLSSFHSARTMHNHKRNKLYAFHSFIVYVYDFRAELKSLSLNIMGVYKKKLVTSPDTRLPACKCLSQVQSFSVCM